MKEKHVIILRGVSGSGKSTEAKAWFDSAKENGLSVDICSADDFFTCGGEYEFQPHLLGEAHAWCLEMFIVDIFEAKLDLVIVDNTNVRRWEFVNYEKLAVAAGYRVTVQAVHQRTNRMTIETMRFFAERCKHGLTASQIAKQALNWED